MATNHTTNYNLNLWAPTDKFVREEFNENTSKLDAAIKAVDAKADTKADASTVTALAQTVNTKASTAALNALAQTVAGKGNCQIATGTYIGSGGYGHTLQFDFKPELIIVTGLGYDLILIRGAALGSGFGGESNPCVMSLTWTENSVNWYSGSNYKKGGPSLDEEGHVYTYIVFYKMA